MGERRRELLLLVVGDVLLFISALWVTLGVRYLSWPNRDLIELHLNPFLLLTIIWIGLFYLGGLYDKHTNILKSLLLGRIISIQIVNAGVALLIFATFPLGITPKTNLVIYLLVSTIFLTVWRLYLFSFFSSKTTRRAILLADGVEAIELADEVNNNDRYNYRFVRLVDKSTAAKCPDFEQKLLEIIKRDRIEIIVANPYATYLENILPKVFQLAFLDHKITFVDFYQVYEDIFDRVPLSSLKYSWFLDNISQMRNPLYEFGKRVFDIVVSLALGVLLLLLLPFIYVAVRLEGRGPLFIYQERLGRYNLPLRVYKLRTMEKNQSASATWTTEDGKSGNRVTQVGALLRKLSVDELPQVLAILRGQMSLIGPRNDIVGLAERAAANIPYYYIRNLVKPGVTGWAQVNQRYMGENISPQSIAETRMRLAYDLYYIKNRSFFLDMTIAIKTIKTILVRLGGTTWRLRVKK